jgi:murein L,D-transpeptidase YafK
VRQGKNGHGIWLHGTPSDTYSRPPRASDGCVVLTNPDIKALAPVLRDGNTPVVIASESAVAADEVAQQKEALMAALEQWRADWQRQETDAYLEHYSRSFFNSSMDFDAWAREKRRIQSAKPKVSVSLSDVSIFRYPDTRKQMAVVNFNQDYRADHFNNKMRKRQYWILENGRWRILYEGAA